MEKGTTKKLRPEDRAFLRAADEAGLPQDQLMFFVRAQYCPLPWALPFHASARGADYPDGAYWIMVGGARGPGKSYAVFMQMVDDCNRAPRIKLIYLRQMLKTSASSLDDLVGKTLLYLPHDYTPSTGVVKFPNGSRIVVAGYNHERDINQHIGINYDGGGIEEQNQISETKLILIRGSFRSTVPYYNDRVYGSANPGGVGHRYIKDNWVKPHKDNEQGSFIGGKTKFFPATHRDNPFLKASYLAYLSALPGKLGVAWRDGDWDAFEGMAFENLTEERNIIERREFPTWWPRVCGIDWGFSAPFVCVWIVIDPSTGRRFVYRVLKQAKLTDVQQARAIREYTGKDEKIQRYFADPSMWSPKNVEGKVTSTYQEYYNNGITLTKADNDRRRRKRKMEQMLGDLPDGEPGFQIVEGTDYIFDDLIALESDDLDPEKVSKAGDDHVWDAVSYTFTDYHSEESWTFEEEQKNIMAPIDAAARLC